ncbi:nucleotidyl transferase [Catenovulum agarivorans DS-2]|uniref:Nucleotidyl transferase n=1 Tax=Catenovulum agarivorans DS-2 TaxID=1328313 RepID=W7QAX1_9ALTE|nr:nucleotidyltransferase family protein [Catenovulum agarivorans]EWH09106.1 nucleotidyl transferase [Catenovulum agarivorans DS-2]
MQAMILAAGQGKRMRPLTEKTPKPLLPVAGKALIEYQIEALVKAGINELVINHAWLGEQIPTYLGNGEKYNCNIQYSAEPIDAYETAGGIIHALPLLKDESFIVINSDVWCDFDYQQLLSIKLQNKLAHLVLVENPAHNPQGDFALEQGQVKLRGSKKYTFAGIGLYHRALFAGNHTMPLPLGRLLKQHIANMTVSGQLHSGLWFDIGTPERLAAIEKLQTHQ